MPKTLEVNITDLTFECIVEGKKENELVLLLHGFPESSFMWRRLMKDLSAAGYYCVAPNLRGYSKGACPRGKRHYVLQELVNDVIAIARHFTTDRFHLVGHDWGALIGWQMVNDYEDSILSWTALSVPHPQAFGLAVLEDEEQRKMSQYIRYFQWPLLPEMRIRKNDFKLFRRLWKNSSDDEVDHYLNIFRNRQQLTAALNYYRANYNILKKAAKGQIIKDVHVPTLFIWGNKDPAIGSTSVNNGHQYARGYYEFLELDTGHWLIQMKYNEVRSAIKHHLQKFKKEIPDQG
jgi:pimeloyl-ACP methyl ester carboxylesterase